MANTQAMQSVASYDNSPYFERALRYGVQHGLLDPGRIEEIIQDAAKGTPQVAEYFGASSHLRANLEQASRRMVHLVSLYLEHVTEGDLARAALSLQQNSFRSHSRGGSEMLRALYRMPESSSLGALRIASEKEFLAACSAEGMTAREYRLKLDERASNQRDMDFAAWLAGQFGIPAGALGKHGEIEAGRIIRTALLLFAYAPKKTATGRAGFPDREEVFRIFNSIRREWGLLGEVTSSRTFLQHVPPEFHQAAEAMLGSIGMQDIRKIVTPSVPMESVFNDIGFKYFFKEDMSDDESLVGVSKFDRMLAEEWFSMTDGTDDDSALLTLFLCIASDAEPKTVLTASEAKKMILNMREKGIREAEVPKLIAKAPAEEIDQLLSLWGDFIEDARPYLLDVDDEKLKQVMDYLKGHCNIRKPKSH
ncbi:hypothetical protein GALL_350230 [mine drainage metagenome]|uniref:Uncharacterized protein n=1 Tax=mine drainage metagenome TaxID=410659 RepID=A0A1J5QI71_9ZZZZ